MKFFINIIVFAITLYFIKATKFSEEEIRMFLPYIKRWVPPPCPMNEIYKTCTGKCSDCTQRGRCVITECQEGCDCAPQFFRITPDGPCEPVANCPKPECGENEVFRACGPVCETCTFLQCRAISCEYKCYCKEGYLRSKDGVCIPEEECPKRTYCLHGEAWAESGPIDEFCLYGTEKEIPTSKTQDIPGCYCKEGYKRSFVGNCMNETTCSNIGCFGVEVYHECIPKCNTTCRNYGDPDCIEDENCYPGCFCPPGYVMNDFRSCIEIENCTLDIEQLKMSDEVKDDYDTTDTTLGPTCAATDETTLLADDSISVADITEAVTKESAKEEGTSVTTKEKILIYESETSPTPAPEYIAKEKSNQKEKILKQKETKHENIAKGKDVFKYKFEEDEDGNGNDDI